MFERATAVVGSQCDESLKSALDDRTLRILERRRNALIVKRRGWLMRRILLAADVVGLALAFCLAELLFGAGLVAKGGDALIFLGTLPLWVIGAKIYGLYDHDEERTDHSTIDDLVSVFHLVTVGTWITVAGWSILGSREIDVIGAVAFWGVAIGIVVLGRSFVRGLCRRRLSYLQNTVIVGAGDIGQLVARKFLQHPEYGINLVGFVDAAPKERRNDLNRLTILGPPEELPTIVRSLDIERVVVAFSNESHENTLELIRSLKNLSVQIDLVPRLFEVVGPSVGIHTVEGLPLVSLPATRISRSSRLIKRGIDVLAAAALLALTAPLFAYVAVRIKFDSRGPVFFRQTRFGRNMRPFMLLKFRSMRADADAAPHRAYILGTDVSLPEGNGLYKLARDDAVTPFGRWLRRTSIDELPQLINVLRGDMSLVGPRPCIPYETEVFAPHHFERFLVPAGITGLWQVTARAHSTFMEALDMDVAYVRGWSLSLDINLMLKTLKTLVPRSDTA